VEVVPTVIWVEVVAGSVLPLVTQKEWLQSGDSRPFRPPKPPFLSLTINYKQ
jgi:hypothetical protein